MINLKPALRAFFVGLIFRFTASKHYLIVESVRLKSHCKNMKEEIKESINNPQKLELLYRSNNKLFKESFFLVYNSDSPSEIEQCWQERLKENNKGISFGSSKEGWFVVGLCALAIFLIYLPEIFFRYDIYKTKSEYFQNYFSFFNFPIINLLVAWKNNFEDKKYKY
ncbi:MAG: hypothetical protein ACOVMN_04825, partial [Flexibacteraceae bacterium]